MVPTPKKSASTPKKSASTPKSTPKKSGSTPKSIRTPRSSKKLEKSLDHLELAEETSPLYSVSFLSDEDSDLIQDVERIAHYKPTLSDIPEEDSEAHTMLGKYSKTSNLIGNRIYDAQSYGFQTPKKSNSMIERTAQILQKCASPIPSRLLTPSRMREEIKLRLVTPLKDDSPEKIERLPSKRRLSSVNGTPAKGGRSSNTTTPVKSRNGSASVTPPKSGTTTPLRKLALSGEGPPTPMSTRRSLKRTLVKEKLRARQEEVEETSESDSDDDDDEEGSEESGSEDEDSASAQKKPAPVIETPSKTATRGRKKIAIKENPENYFNSHSDGKILTSDKTLSHLNTPRLSQDALKHILSGEKLRFQPEIDMLISEYKSSFPKLMLQLLENFNLLFYGLGSKRSLLGDFHTTMLNDRNVVVVNGFFPSLTLKQILNAITHEMMGTEVTLGSPSEQVDYIFKNLEEDLFLIVHNIDGGMLRGDKNQSIIARLASHPKIHLICSIDHINAPLMWDQQKLSQFNFVWYDVTTFLPYTEETLNENSLMVKQSGALALNSLTRLFASLTPNAKGIYIIIVKYQMEGVKEFGTQCYSGFSFKTLYRVCRKAYLVNGDLALRAQLTEFRDHKLIRSRKGTDGIEYLTIPLDNATLQEFLEQQNQAETN